MTLAALWAELPLELQAYVLSCMRGPDVIKCGAVCRLWRRETRVARRAYASERAAYWMTRLLMNECMSTNKLVRLRNGRRRYMLTTKQVAASAQSLHHSTAAPDAGAFWRDIQNSYRQLASVYCSEGRELTFRATRKAEPACPDPRQCEHMNLARLIGSIVARFETDYAVPPEWRDVDIKAPRANARTYQPGH
jgi:hypothetical protein